MYGQYQGGGRPEPETPTDTIEAAEWLENICEIGRFWFRESDFVNDVIVPKLANNIPAILAAINGATPICYMPNSWTASYQAKAASLGSMPLRVSDSAFGPGIVLRVVFFVQTTRPQKFCDRFSSLLAGMPDQQGVSMGDFYKR